MYLENIFCYTQSKVMSLDDGTNVQYQRIRVTRISEFPFYPLHFIWRGRIDEDTLFANNRILIFTIIY